MNSHYCSSLLSNLKVIFYMFPYIRCCQQLRPCRALQDPSSTHPIWPMGGLHWDWRQTCLGPSMVQITWMCWLGCNYKVILLIVLSVFREPKHGITSLNLYSFLAYILPIIVTFLTLVILWFLFVCLKLSFHFFYCANDFSSRLRRGDDSLPSLHWC